MKKNSIPKYFLVFFLLSMSLFAEESKIDSLISLPYDQIVSEPKKLIPQLISVLKNNGTTDRYKNAKLYSNLALAYSSISDFANYREAAINAIKLFEETNSELDLTLEYGLFGFHLRRTNIDRAKYYMQLSIKLGEKNNFINELRGIYDNYGVLLEFTNDLDSALYFYKKALDIKYTLSDSIGIPYGLNHLAGLYAMQGNMEEAFKCMEESDKYRAKEKSFYGRAENAVIFGELYESVGKYNLAIKKYNESLELAKLMGNKYMAQYNYEKLSGIYEKRKDFEKAYTNLLNHKSYQDSILNTETNEKIAELEIKFETEKKDKEISEAKLRLKEQREQIAIAVGFSFLLLIAIIAIYRFQKYKRKQIRRELELKNKVAKVEFEKKISDEKLRISRELHDNIGSHLTFMISSIDNLTYSSDDEKYTSKLNKLSSFGRNTLNELRQTIWAMKKSESTIHEFILKLTELKKQILTNIDIQINNTIEGEIKLSSTQTLNLFRVVQEAIQNSIKYANANKIEIHFAKNNSNVLLKIKDDGTGFDINTVELGNGIKNMEYRCKEANASFSIVSSPQGTVISCNIKLGK